MRIGIPTYGEFISPRFDCAGTLVVVEKVDGGKERFSELSLSGVHHRMRPAFLANLGITVLLCGGIRRCDLFSTEQLGIQVVAGLMGSWKSILEEFKAGRLEAGTGPGYGLGARRRRQGGRGQNRSGIN